MTTLKDLYIEELQDLWSANDQMTAATAGLSAKAADRRLGERLKKSEDGIRQHTATLRSLVEEAGGTLAKDHCKGMEGLVAEAHKHAIDADLTGPVLDAAIIAQYQRMCHYGIAGFGTVKAFARALGYTEAARKLEEMVAHIYDSDGYMTELAEQSRNAKAAA